MTRNPERDTECSRVVRARSLSLVPIELKQCDFTLQTHTVNGKQLEHCATNKQRGLPLVLPEVLNLQLEISFGVDTWCSMLKYVW